MYDIETIQKLELTELNTLEDKIIDLTKERNFFETRVTEYQPSASLSWD